MVTLRSRASRKASTLLSARLALRVRELALELREVERREPEEPVPERREPDARALERREPDARDPLAREPPDLRDELREPPRREPELPEPCAIC